jgi:hypothetical protein
MVVLTVRGATSVSDQRLAYDAIILHSEELTPRKAAERFLSGSTGPAPDLPDGLSFPTTAGTLPYWMTTEPSPRYYLSRPEWPEYYFNSTFGSSADASVRMLELLTKGGLPFYPTVQAAFAEILYGIPPTDLQTNFNPHVLVRLPDLRARLGPTRFEDGSVVLNVEEGKVGGCQGSVILVAWRISSGDNTWKRAELPVTKPDSATLDIGGIPSEMWALLVDSAGNVLDRYGWSDTLGQRPELLGSISARVVRWLSEGEHQQLEYKQELGPKANRSFAETVAAFANGDGGIILVGVGDDASVIGYGQAKVEDQIANIVRELVVDPVNVQVEKVTIDEKPLYVLTVPAGEPAMKPYRVSDRVMVRVLGTTRVATTAEIRRLARQADGQSSAGYPLRWHGSP